MLKEYSILVDREQVEKISDALLERGAFSVSIEDAEADKPDEEPIYGEPGLEPTELAWNHSRIKVLTDEAFNIAAAIEDSCSELNVETFDIECEVTVPDNDWVRLTQAQFTPVQITENLWIVPSWHQPPDSKAINIKLDPGAAFGTGTHPTTQLCLQWLSSHNLSGKSILDYGCGSGILAIAALKLGAQSAYGTDIDKLAIEAANYNAGQNAASAYFVLPQDLPDKKFDVVVANILSNPLKVLAAALTSRVASGGHLVLSGILERQADDLIAVYNTHMPELNMSVWKSAEGWVCLAGRKA